MSDEYDSWRRYEDAKAFKNKLAEIDQLKDRIEKLEAALRSIAANACYDSCRQAWPVPRTTNPWPLYQACGVCGIGGDINKAMSFVCNNPQCPTRVTCISTTGTAT